ncbi:hypothetical protein QQ008_07695 [Fulvivirgaceae bacterium BMA10]|uniref:Uncharacterized protein n=1 Tax=Splendidivirga corallicola TaxID=3051826 RepID=A0ABT8KLY0_9BACT|nr:hypothetical protein [Fulvivirgaceae bacterium BMA10]
MKKPDYLIIVSTETGEGKEVTKADIIELHTNSRAHGGQGFNRPGFDYLVQTDGKLETILQEENPNEVDLWGISEGMKGIMGTAKFLAYAGGMTEKATKEKDTRTDLQKDTLATVVKFYVRRFPEIQVLGWDQIPGKEGSKNPAFDVPKWLQEIGVPSDCIYQVH